jgi:transcriptional regulator with XRE-family HTH domain
MTQEELADQCGLSVRTIRNLERGSTARPYPSSVGRLAAALRLTDAGRYEFARARRPAPGDPGTAPVMPVPRQLPAAAADFTGRSAELEALDRLLDADGGLPGTVVVSAIGGTAGVGKTALAVQLAGLHPGPDLDAYAAAALTATTLNQARQLLDVLARAHLIQPTGPGRHGMHDLLRAYAAEQAADQDGPDEEQAALTQLFDHYLHTAAAAMDTLYPAEQHRRPRIPPPATQHTAALGLARQTGDKYQQARAYDGLGRACHAAGNPGQARRHWQQALILYADPGSPEADQVRAQLSAGQSG